MSIQVQRLVWDRSQADGTALLVLHALADFAEDDGGGVWPSIATLASKCRLSARQAQTLIRRLESLGELEVRPGGGRSRSNQYRVRVEVLAQQRVQPSVVTEKGCSPASINGAAQRQKGCSPASERVRNPAPDPPVDPPRDPSVIHHAAAAAAEQPIDARWQRSATGRLQTLWREHMGDAARAPLTATQLRKGLDLELRAIEQGRAELVTEAMAYTAERGKPWMYFLTTLAGWLDGNDFRQQPAPATAGRAPINYDFAARADRWLAAGSD